MNRISRYILLLTFVAVPTTNYVLPRILAEGNQFSDDPETRVAAAAYAFAIWGVIFTGLLWFSATLAFGKEPDTQHLRRAIIGLIIAGLASIAFVPISIYLSFTIGWIDILAHLVPLGFSVFYLRKHVVASVGNPIRKLSRWSFFGPSMYFGWISAATVISTSLMATEVGIELPDEIATGLAIATLLLLGAIAIWMAWKCDPVYAMTVGWALIAVGVKQQPYPSIRWTAWSVAVVLVAALGYTVVVRGKVFYSVAMNSCRNEMPE